jgi:hypothetical protein
MAPRVVELSDVHDVNGWPVVVGQYVKFSPHQNRRIFCWVLKVEREQLTVRDEQGKTRYLHPRNVVVVGDERQLARARNRRNNTNLVLNAASTRLKRARRV